MSQIILLGTEGCGKTILLTILAQKYRSVTADGFFLEAMNSEANAFTNQNWHILNDQQEWPPATPPGSLRNFRWKLKLHFGRENQTVRDLVAGDFAGEVFRAAFGRDDLSSSEAKELKQYIDQSDALLLLVNLKDYINEQDISRKSETEWALKNCLDYGVQQKFQSIAIVFTQVDRYEAVFAECQQDDRAVLNKYLPQIAGAHPNVEVLRVSAVNGTVLAEQADGLAMERPAVDFGSIGIPELVTWVSCTKERIHKFRQTPSPMPPPPVLPTSSSKSKKIAIAVVLGIALVIGIIVFSDHDGAGGRGGSGQQQPPPPPIVPIPVITKDARFVGTGNFESYGIECWGRVVNKGAAGNVIVHVKFTQGTKESPLYTKAQRLDQGESFDFYYKDTDTFYQRDGLITYSAWPE